MAGMEVSSTSMGVAGAMTHGVSYAGTHGCMKADNNNAWVQMLGHVSSMGWVTDTGGGLLGHRNAWRWGNPDVSSTRCNKGHGQYLIAMKTVMKTGEEMYQ